jgi:hypothetical protein
VSVATLFVAYLARDVTKTVNIIYLLRSVNLQFSQVGGLETVLGGVVPISLIRGVDNLIS